MVSGPMQRAASSYFPSRRLWLLAGASSALALAQGACAQPGRAAAIDELAAQWRALRTQRGHFDGAAFNADVDRWQGRKHVLMQQLAAHALEQRLHSGALRRLLGTPDETWREGQGDHAAALQQARWQGTPRGTLAVFHWRGRHDRLVFALHADRVVAAGWLYTLE